MIGHVETVVLDSQGLSAWITQDRKLIAVFQVFHSMGADFVIGANTIVEVSHTPAASVAEIFTDSHETYGYRRVHAALARRGEHCSAEPVRPNGLLGSLLSGRCRG